MAAARRGKKKVVVRVELGWGGLFSLAVVVFCLLLWMFLLGLWAGKTVLAPAETAGPAARVNLLEGSAEVAGHDPFPV